MMQIPGMGRQQSCRGCRTWIAKLSYVIKELGITEEKCWEKAGDATRVKLERMFLWRVWGCKSLGKCKVQEN